MGLHVSYGDLAAKATAGQYTLQLRNQSSAPWTFFVYQQLPNQSGGTFPVAWFASPFAITPGGGQITFGWETTDNFVWSQTGTIVPGVVFNASQVIGASRGGANTTNFSAQPYPNLSPAAPGGPAGQLAVRNGSDVPNNMFSVGIGMSGAATLVTQAGPNLVTQFSPSSPPRYWVAAGLNVQVGTVLDVQAIGNAAEAVFPVNISSIIGTLGQDNTWSFQNAPGA